MLQSNTKYKIVVVIPVYKSFSEEEKCSFLQCIQVLKRYDIIIVKPRNLDLNDIKKPIKQISLHPKWFESIHSYNRLVLSYEFYLLFSTYDYMLIYQLDAYVFEDRLTEWALKGYDYIGAPWLPNSSKYECIPGKWLLRIRVRCNRLFRRRITSADLHYRVGNGGFSLRKISKMLLITTKYRDLIEDFLSKPRKKFQEDIFLSLLLPVPDQLNVPDYKEATGFAFELNPKKAYEYNQFHLPFGCHDWYRKRNWNQFWKYYIRLNFIPQTK